MCGTSGLGAAGRSSKFVGWLALETERLAHVTDAICGPHHTISVQFLLLLDSALGVELILSRSHKLLSRSGYQSCLKVRS